MLLPPSSDLGFFQSRGREAPAMSRPRDLANGVRPSGTAAEARTMTILFNERVVRTPPT